MKRSHRLFDDDVNTFPVLFLVRRVAAVWSERKLIEETKWCCLAKRRRLREKAVGNLSVWFVILFLLRRAQACCIDLVDDLTDQQQQACPATRNDDKNIVDITTVTSSYSISVVSLHRLPKHYQHPSVFPLFRLES